MFFASLFYFIQETLNRRIPPDGNRVASRVAGMPRGGKARNLERFEYIVDGERLDEEGEQWSLYLLERPASGWGSQSLCSSLKERREKMSTSYLMIPDSCAPTAGGSGVFVSVLHMSVLRGSLHLR